ncbi:hypothetical protein SDC9_44428 [bioreactor metagenome]|uniref:Uncharacterized protein n=1 Tax=bioreactor metagenome TaxID=1076179 RepID=A0A644W3S2_9ZZZZ
MLLLQQIEELQAVAHPQFRINVLDVGLYGIGGDEEFLRNLLIAQSLDQEVDDLCLPFRDSKLLHLGIRKSACHLIGEEVTAADEVVQVHREDGEAEIHKLECHLPEEKDVQREQDDQGQEGVADAFQQPLLLPGGRFFCVDAPQHSMNDQKHACTEEMVPHGVVQSLDPVSSALCKNDVEAEDEKDKNQKGENAVAQMLLLLGRPDQLDQVPAEHQKQERGQQYGEKGRSQGIGLIETRKQVLLIQNPAQVGGQQSQAHLKTQRGEHGEKRAGIGITHTNAKQHAQAGNRDYQGCRQEEQDVG